jgi:DNA polymerase I-like protein with 3'-5' exonuclease and polymerase domains
MILQVHDELVFDIPISEKEIFEKMVREIME